MSVISERLRQTVPTQEQLAAVANKIIDVAKIEVARLGVGVSYRAGAVQSALMAAAAHYAMEQGMYGAYLRGVAHYAGDISAELDRVMGRGRA